MGVGDPEFDAYRPSRAPRAVVRFDVIGEAWSLILASWRVWMPVVLVVLAGYWMVTGLELAIIGPRHADRIGGFRFGIPEAREAIPFVIGAIITGFFVAGMFRVACRQVRGESFGVMDLFSIADVLAELVLGLALYAAALFVGLMFCIIPALLVHGLFMFTIPLIVDGRLKATQAIATSFHTLKDEWLTATLFHVVISFLSPLGMCACCVGLLFTAPLYVLSIALLYRDTFLAKGSRSVAKPSPPFHDI